MGTSRVLESIPKNTARRLGDKSKLLILSGHTITFKILIFAL